ncbi:MAG: SDR family oxidoreductase [Myxococcales bacterium]|nr:SDR family oxidoreductase [Myxococcales bacterium]
MKLAGKHAVVTGGANGIGRALARKFSAEGARVVIADLDLERASTLASEIDGLAAAVDVGDESSLRALVERAEREGGPIDLFCSNAGIGVLGGVEVENEHWQEIWEVNVMAHVYAARAVLPSMLERGEGYLLNTASAAGLLTQIDSACYSVTKHAAVGFAEWLAVSYGDRGIAVSVLCPQAVRTAMTAESANGGVAGVDGMIEPEEVADCVIEALGEERFMILPHPTVAKYLQNKVGDYDGWLSGMRRLRARFQSS